MFSDEFIALSREAAISGQSLGEGLAALRKANYAATGLYSHAFFSLSIGFERILKLIFIIDHKIQNNSYPTNDELKNKFGHNIEELYKYAKTVYDRLQNKYNKYELISGGIEENIICFLSMFAKINRYYNLNYLVGSNNSGVSVDPIKEWHNKIGNQLVSRHYSEAQKKKDTVIASKMDKMFGDFALVRYTAEDGASLNNMESAILQTGINKIIQKYGTFYTAKIARFLYLILCDIVRDANSKGHKIPYLDEFFFPFYNDDRYLLSRKTFPPRGQ